ncbi:MAG: hypothetical protein Q9183_004737 [Haloplaca sp. 2 TL-2023]
MPHMLTSSIQLANMPKGQKIADWTNPDNSEKFVHAIIAAGTSIDCKKVAEIFGNDMTVGCIQTRVSTLRKQAREKGLLSDAPIADGPKAPRAGAKGTKMAKKVATDEQPSEHHDESTANKDDVPANCTDENPEPAKAKTGKNKVISGRVTKPRAKSAAALKKEEAAKLKAEAQAEADKVMKEDVDADHARQAMTPEDSVKSDKNEEVKHEQDDQATGQTAA